MKGASSNNANAYKTPSPEITLKEVSGDDHIIGNPNADIVMVEFSDTECPFCKRFHETLHQVIDNYGKDGKVSWVYRHFPIDQLHEKARKEAEATECAYELGGADAFWSYIDSIYAKTPSNDGLDVAELPKTAQEIGLDVAAFNTCLASGKHAEKVEADYQDAAAAGGRGTPYTILVLSEDANKDVYKFVDEANTQFQVTPGNEVVFVSKDKKKVAVSGAMPYDFMTQLIDTILK